MLTELLCDDDVLDDFAFNNDRVPLAAQPIRSVKNNVICTIAVICRHAADLGADDERCYALSDYYINEVENETGMDQWEKIVRDIIRHYGELVKNGWLKSYSLPIRRSLRYIHQHLYEKCSLKDVASAVELHPNYLSMKFKAEVGVLITEYITDKKMEEAKSLLQNSSSLVSDVAEVLGFESLSYFTKLFKKKYYCTPSEFRQKPVTDVSA
ncbi:hypothetical protein FACS18947_5470 [Bacteroidia bacterium]|nr:hypothetical protein FACS18947_5470 [Bacteroidia bacterium]